MLNKINRNIDKRIVVSSVVAAFMVGGIIMVLNKVGLKQVADIAKGGK